jgi:hypothetical protein
MMQTDVLSAHLNASGFFLLNGTSSRLRLKQITYSPNGGNAGSLWFFDTLVVPTTAVYQRTGNTVTVTSTNHGLTSGQQIGIAFGGTSGGSGTDGNYVVTVTGTSTFTVTDPSSGSVSGGTPCYYVIAYPNGVANNAPQKFVTAFDTFTSQTNTQQVLIPGEGVLIQNGLYAQFSYITFCTIFYG